MNGLNELAEQAGLYFYEFVWTSPTDECMYPEGVYQEALERFAKLVAAKEHEWMIGYIRIHQPSFEQLANAIRARGEA